jgi:hypothetical protein
MQGGEMKKLKAVALLLGLALSLPSPLWGQEKADGKVNFTDLRDKRQQIAREIEQAQQEMFVQRERIGRMPALFELEGYQKGSKARIEELTRDLEAARKQPGAPRVNQIEAEIRSQQQGLVRLEDDMKLRREFDSKMNELQGAVNKRQAELVGIESRIDDLLRRDVVTQNFKLMMSMTFAFLVLAVIACFFWIAYNDKRVRRTIFAGEAGIQFITLFSLVIAIILFGITGILGDKELSALLGGLSGYILGRSMNPRGGATPPATGTAPPAGPVTGTGGAAAGGGAAPAGATRPQPQGNP